MKRTTKVLFLKIALNLVFALSCAINITIIGLLIGLPLMEWCNDVAKENDIDYIGGLF